MKLADAATCTDTASVAIASFFIGKPTEPGGVWKVDENSRTKNVVA